MILYYEHGVMGRITRAICNCTETNNKYLHDYDKIKESTSIQHLDFNNQYRWALSQPLPYARFDYVEEISMFSHDFIINYKKLILITCINS